MAIRRRVQRLADGGAGEGGSDDDPALSSTTIRAVPGATGVTTGGVLTS
jgi:hypothetical protein